MTHVTAHENPLSGSPPDEIPLRDAPLVLVLAQVRFPLITSVGSPEFIGSFQEAIRREYPILRQDGARGWIVGPDGVREAQSSVIWRFTTGDEQYRISLGPEFVTLETRDYSSRQDFLDRLRQVLAALEEHIAPGACDRLGIRYIDRIQGDQLEKLPQLLRSEVSGVLATPLGEQAHHALSEQVFGLPDEKARLMARWGLVPKGGTFDPAAIPAIDERSWVLDVDVFAQDLGAFDVDMLIARTEEFAARSYGFFRWVVTEYFLEVYGGGA